MKALVTVVAVLVLSFVGSVAARTTDVPKEAEGRLPWMQRAAFSRLHGDDADWKSRWQGFGSFEQARDILKAALDDTTGAPGQDRSLRRLEAIKRAAHACGNQAVKYRRLLDVLAEGASACSDWMDVDVALSGGMDYLVSGGGSSLCQSMLTLGLSMARGAMTGYRPAHAIMEHVVKQSMIEAQMEHLEWHSLLEAVGSAAKGQSDCTISYRSCYLALERSAHAVAFAEAGRPVFIPALAAIVAAKLDSIRDLFRVLMHGLRNYARDCTSRAHKELALLVWDCGASVRERGTWMLGACVEQLLTLAHEAPAARVLLQAARDLSSPGFRPSEDALTVASKACEMARAHLPSEAAARLDQALADAKAAAPDQERQIEVLRRAMAEVLGR